MTLVSAIFVFAASVLTSVSDVAEALRRNETNRTFDLTVRVTTVFRGYARFTVEDESGRTVLTRNLNWPTNIISAGDTVRVSGHLVPPKFTQSLAHCRTVKILSHGSAPQPLPVPMREFHDGTHDARLVRVEGSIIEAFRDERDPDWIYLVLTRDGDCAYAAFKSEPADALDYRALIGCDTRIIGYINPDGGGARHHVGRMLIARGPEAIEIVSRPSWWTARKLLVILSVLTAALVASLVWCRSLRVIAERRSRELLREKVARIAAEMRVDERTRLASDLHDSVAQSLTGVSLQINTALRLADVDSNRMRLQLERASKSIRSCREELRNCLWDLRGKALDTPDMNEAIRLTLLPQMRDDVALTIRFNVPRHKLLDNTAHTILQIVRELVANAISHGHARRIRIAGSLDGHNLMFSVQDDGCGFDPDHVPGSIDGHFGLQGIRERLQKNNGNLKIVSSSSGTKVTVTLS